MGITRRARGGVALFLIGYLGIEVEDALELAEQTEV